MSRQNNRTSQTGRLPEDAEILSTPNGKRYANFRLGVDEGYRNRDTGEWVERTTWLPFTTWSEGIVSMFEKHIKKGVLVQVSGRVGREVWESKTRKNTDGSPATDSRLVLVVDEISPLAWPKNGEGRGDGASAPAADAPRAGAPAGQNFADEDDGIPF